MEVWHNGVIIGVLLSGCMAEGVTAATKDTDMASLHRGFEYQEKPQTTYSPTFCPGVNNRPPYLCETGYCCGESGCCTYYYELWWFWLLWTVLLLFSCCCAYRHRRAKLRLQQQQRQREINLMAYHRACSYPDPALDLSLLAAFKLPSYEEVAAQPSTPPPPYSVALALHGSALYARAGPSGLTSSHSSGNCTSCSCDSCSLSSPCSTSFSVQVTDEALTSNATTPSDSGHTCRASPFPGPHPSSPTPAEQNTPTQPAPPISVTPVLLQYPQEAEACQSGEDPTSRVTHSPLKHTLFSSSVCVFEPDGREPSIKCSEQCGEDDLNENHFRHRSLTGDSGIEVCRCQVRHEEDDEETEKCAIEGGELPEEVGLVHDSVDCSHRALSVQSQLPTGDSSQSLAGDNRQSGPTSAKQRGEDSVITVQSS
ncbi:WW domain binding protein 1-like isoform X2 [Brachyhypopomus gauderio]|uniref:WW domain binding protein 1-like isoform X2 n=1 Tax=Brachyhypopomus gauderio TaxID=698409 RepID=UPI004041C4A2